MWSFMEVRLAELAGFCRGVPIAFIVSKKRWL